MIEREGFRCYLEILLEEECFQGIIIPPFIQPFKFYTYTEFVNKFSQLLTDYFCDIDAYGKKCASCCGDGKVFKTSSSGAISAFITCTECNGVGKVL